MTDLCLATKDYNGITNNTTIPHRTDGVIASSIPGLWVWVPFHPSGYSLAISELMFGCYLAFSILSNIPIFEKFLE